MPNPRRTLWLSLAATLAGALALRLYVGRLEVEIAGGPPRRVLALGRDLAPGDALVAAALTVRELPLSYVEGRHVLASDEPAVVGARAAVALHAGDALLWSDLSSMRSSARQLSRLVPEGMRALSLDVRGQSFGRLLLPGDRVDVIEASPAPAGSPPPAALAQGLLVLAVGDDLGEATGRAQTGSGGGSTSVTLALSPEQGRRLATARRQTALALLLRNPDDVTLDVVPAREEAPWR